MADQSPPEKSRAKPTKNDETSVPGSKPYEDPPTKVGDQRWGQVSLDEVTSITWVHDRDQDHYHDPYCEYKMRNKVFDVDGGRIVSGCAHCGRTVESTLASYEVTDGT